MHLARRSARRRIPIAFVLGSGRRSLWPRRALPCSRLEKNKNFKNATVDATAADWYDRTLSSQRGRSTFFFFTFLTEPSEPSELFNC